MQHPVAHFLKPPEPIVSVGLPVAAGVFVADFNLADVLGVLEAEFGWNAYLHGKSVLPRQYAVVEPERQYRLRVERRRHIDRRRVLIVAMERDVLGAKVCPDSAQEFGELHTTPLADGAPSLDADVPCDLRD